MIGYIKGIVSGIFDDYILLENQGIGFRIFTSGRVLSEIGGNGTEVKIYTYMNVREDEISLFGFPTSEELDAFKMLITVNGIGPKAALSILSVLSVKELSLAIMTGDTKAITRANGVGAKGAGRVIMELKDKLKFEDMLSIDNNMVNDETVITNSGGSNIQDTVLALVSLGYSEFESMKAIRQIPDAENMDADKLLKAALKKIF